MGELSPKGPPDGCIVVIFGASGDLAKRKLVPALHNLQMEGLIPRETSILGTSRTEYDDDGFRETMRAAVQQHSRIAPDPERWEGFSSDIHYLPGDVTDPDFMRRLGERLKEIDDSNGTKGNRIWYLALLPQFFGSTADGLADAGLTETGGWQRIIVEKPFGYDLATAKELSEQLQRCFHEPQIYRIDHYLGKETVQNLLVFRFANAIFEPIWNRRHVDNVQITVAEDIGVESRGSFYERVGALCDVAQNHLLSFWP